MSRFWSSYEYPFNKNHVCPQGIYKTSAPGFCRVVTTPKFLCYLTFELFLTKWLSQNFYLLHLGKKGMGGGLVALRCFLNLKKNEIELLISNQMSPIWSLYEHPFRKTHICHQGLTYNARPPVPGGLCRHRSLVLWPLNYLRKNGCLKICIAWVWGKKGVGGLVALPSLLNLKKWNRTYNFHSIELSEFYLRIPSIRTIYAPWA